MSNLPADLKGLKGPDGIKAPFVTQELAQRAVELVLPALERALTLSYVGESGFLHIVVMDPRLTPEMATFDEAILYEHSIGDRSRWDADYGAYARAKAHVSWHTGLDSHLVQSLRPHLLQKGDTTLWGSVALDGIVVGASGTNPPYDEAFAGMVAMAVRALAKEVWHKAMK